MKDEGGVFGNECGAGEQGDETRTTKASRKRERTKTRKRAGGQGGVSGTRTRGTEDERHENCPQRPQSTRKLEGMVIGCRCRVIRPVSFSSSDRMK